MTLSVFLELVELRTKLASVLPFVVGTLFGYVYFGELNLVNTGLFFCAMLLFDMTTTAIDNLVHFKKAKDPTYAATVNVIGRAHLDPRRVLALIAAMLAAATVLGLILVWRTDWLLLVIGMLCFGVGIFYTFGPLPLAQLPLGEVFSGVTMGLGIPFIAVYVNAGPGKLLGLELAWPTLTLQGDFISLIALGLICVTPMATIANIMLANNLSDLQEDLANHRTTLPMYLGEAKALGLWQGLTYAGYFALVAAVFFGAVSWPALAAVLTVPLAARNARRFAAKPDKRKTFPLAIANLVIENGGLAAGLALSLLVKVG
ncbi:1,4-dihydroxy-2-naphthoate polyprenyltransferase [Lacticaseibacillus parakribbianus]|uniref:1,4-dihydroxy-2-naphthoate polyprenyltransferase n=1 Tax=Lacticaseibacillus parakribbianus TaxID=2970927 RepID=UPI0021CAED38|nr:1,4-dihydroxy-2-naphthoate polyprenyltransferase [Lacticaseibacillus parakribbianus]